MVGTRHMLGLAIDDAGVVATELSLQSGRAEVRRTGELLWEQELTADSAKLLGQRLRHFLREQGFSAKRAVVGLAAKWVLTKEVEAPPASPEVLAGMLSIQAERAFSMNADELIFDYCGRTSTTEKRPVLLLAARRQIVDQIKELTEAAGLHGAIHHALGAGVQQGLVCRAMRRPGTDCTPARRTASSGPSWTAARASSSTCRSARTGRRPGMRICWLRRSSAWCCCRRCRVRRRPIRSRPTTPAVCPTSWSSGLGKRLGSQITVSNGRAGLLSKGLVFAGSPGGGPCDRGGGGGDDRRGAGEAPGRFPQSPRRRQEGREPQTRDRLGRRRRGGLPARA